MCLFIKFAVCVIDFSTNGVLKVEFNTYYQFTKNYNVLQVVLILQDSTPKGELHLL